MQTPHNRILYVDNNEDSCTMMKLWLESWGYEVALAATAVEGLRIAQSDPCDLYLCETRLPEISGLALCAQICAASEHAPVVFLSTAAYATDKQHGLQAGAAAYLTKPVDFAILEVTLAGLLSQTLALGRGQGGA